MGLSFEFSNVLGAVYHRGTVRFGPDGSSLFSPVGNKIVTYDLKSNKSSALPLQVNYNFERVCIHPRGTLILAASEKSQLYMISLISGKLLHFKEYKSFQQITHLSFSPDGRYYCVCGENLVLVYMTPGSLIVGKGREIVPFKLLKKFRVTHDKIVDVSWSLNCKYLCVASQDISLNILDLLDQDNRILQLKGHSDSILSCYFANKYNSDFQLYSLTKNCQLFVWDTRKSNDEGSSDESKSLKRLRQPLAYFCTARHYLKLKVESEEKKEERIRKSSAFVCSSDYSSQLNLLVVGYNTGHYSLYEMPGATLIYDLDSNSGLISSISINANGDWIAIGSSIDHEPDKTRATNRTQSRLFVWEWQSKSHVLDQYGSGATMSNMHECLSYSLDGTYLVSGNLSGQIKVWNTLTGETIGTFGDEHKGPIKSIKFAPNKSGKVIVSASLDGTLRAYDLNRYKNFRTFQSPVQERKPEFICLDIDSTGEFIAAGTYNYFEVYLYSLQTGKFLEYLTGHEGPVSGVAFSPVTNLLVTTSWDFTVRIWNLFEGPKTMRDTITFNHEVITIAFRPDGNQFAVSLSNGQIALFNPQTGDQIGAPIEGLDDLGTTQLVAEVSRDSKKYFITLNYSADGTYLVAAGKSNFICIYHTNEKILVKKVAITFNMSMDGIFDFVSARQRAEFGYNLELLDQRKEERTLRPIQLPGVRTGDLSERSAKPVMAVYQINFSPTMRSFAAATTEGVLIYSLDNNRNFDPYKLAIDVDPISVRRALDKKDFRLALVQSIQLNDRPLTKEVLESIPLDDLELVIANLEVDYVKKSLEQIGSTITDTRHLDYYLLLVKKILYRHGIALKSLQASEVSSVVRNLHQNIYRVYMNLKKNCDYYKYSLEYLTRQLPNAMDVSDHKDVNHDDQLLA